MKILIADDHEMLADSLRVLLEAHGHDVIATVGTGCDAVAIAEQHRPDLALLEVAMPEMNGIEATRKIAESSPSTTVVMVSGIDDRDVRSAAIDAGASGFVVKSLQPARLLPMIEAAARGRAAPASALRSRGDQQGLLHLVLDCHRFGARSADAERAGGVSAHHRRDLFEPSPGGDSGRE